jgi:hypothetical protein
MANTTFIWKVANLERETATGKIYLVHYTLDATNGIYKAGAYGSIGLEGEVTIPFAEITEAQVIEWVKAALTEEKVDAALDALENQISEQIAPTKAAGVPWVTVEAS